MNPPIPDPSATPREKFHGPRPDAMKYFIAVSIFITVINFVVNRVSNTARNNVDYLSRVDYLIIYFLVQAIWVTLLWMLWKGRNGARLIIMLLCLAALSNLLSIGELTLLQKVAAIADLAFSIVFFWWLRSPEVLAFTKGNPV